MNKGEKVCQTKEKLNSLREFWLKELSKPMMQIKK